MSFQPKELNGKLLPCYCATCKKKIKLGSFMEFSTTKTGTLKVHHAEDCLSDYFRKHGRIKPVETEYVTKKTLYGKIMGLFKWQR